jgi:menaquinone-dependent protoporphyrinogen oxidase
MMVRTMDEQKKVSRRRFLAIGGTTLGASVLACAGLGYVGTRPSGEVTFAESNCGKGEQMNGRVLVAYASRAGSTGEVAQAVADVLCQQGFEVDVRKVNDVRDVSGYRAVVVGSAARMGKLYGETGRFVNKHRKALAVIPTAYFFSGFMMNEDTPENRATAGKLLEPLVAARQPVSVGLFGGSLKYANLEPLFRWVFSMAKEGMPEGDWRDWDAIRAWSGELAPLL